MQALSRVPLSRALCALFALVASSAPAAAAVQSFGSFESYLPATASLTSTIVDFADELTIGQSTSNLSTSGLRAEEVVFEGRQTNGGGYLFLVRPGFGGNNPNYTGWTGNPVVLQGPPGANAFGVLAGSLRIELPGNTYAAGASFYTVNPGGTLRVSVNGDTPVPFATANKPGLTFFGVVSDVAISEIVVSGVGGTFPNVAHFTYSRQVLEVPEPKMAAMIVAGLFLLLIRPGHGRLRARTK